ncbi:MAG: phosphatase PAP2 family protein [bacterium]
MRETRRHSLIFLLALITALSGLWIFIRLTGQVLKGKTQLFDERIVRSLREPDAPELPIGPWWLPEMARDLTALGSHTLLALITILASGFLYLEKKHHSMWLIITATSSGLLLNILLKVFFGRRRPSVVPPLSWVTMPGFPSGHAMLSVIVYLSLGFLLARSRPSGKTKIYIFGMALLLSFLVGLSRVYLGVHYPTDVAAGWIGGLVWFLLIWLIWPQHW